MNEYINLDEKNIDEEHICCAIGDPKHQDGVDKKKEWIKTLEGVSLASDAFFPFGDNIERARKSGVKYIAQTGGSIRDDNVIETCDKYDIAMAMTGLRLFYH